MTASCVVACCATASHWPNYASNFELWHVIPFFRQSASKFRYRCRLHRPVIYPPCARIHSRQIKTWFIWKQDFIISLTRPMKMTSCTFKQLTFMTLRKHWNLIWETSIKAIFTELPANSLATDSLSVVSKGDISSLWSCKETNITTMLKSYNAVLLRGSNSWCTWFLPVRYGICGKKTLIKTDNCTVIAIETIRSIPNGKACTKHTYSLVALICV
jgi:hypothetical protein